MDRFTLRCAHPSAFHRLAGAFLLVRSVLLTYNPASSYVVLEEWTGQSRADCGHTTVPDELTGCGDLAAVVTGQDPLNGSGR
jgi:hypothetical protein